MNTLNNDKKEEIDLLDIENKKVEVVEELKPIESNSNINTKTFNDIINLFT